MEVEENASGTLKKEITDPYAVYNVEVMENIKGYLNVGEDIEIVQNGGLNKDKKVIVFSMVEAFWKKENIMSFWLLSLFLMENY